MVDHLFKGGDKMLPQITEKDISLLHAAVGIAGEAGEMEGAVTAMRQVGDYWKVYTGEPGTHKPFLGKGTAFPGLDMENLHEELGDHLFYEAALRAILGLETLPNLPISSDVWYPDLSPITRANDPDIGRCRTLCELIGAHVVIADDILDLVKKTVMYRKEMDANKMTQRLVDDCWVINHIALLIGTSEGSLRKGNMEKLLTGKNARYKEGYSDEAAQQRADKQAETNQVR